MADNLEHDLVVNAPLACSVGKFSFVLSNTCDQAVTYKLYGRAYPGGTWMQLASAIAAIGNGTTQTEIATDASATLVIAAGSAVSSNSGTWSLPASYIGGFKITAQCLVTPTVGSITANGGYHA
jgi:hypothetical protein